MRAVGYVYPVRHAARRYYLYDASLAASEASCELCPADDTRCPHDGTTLATLPLEPNRWRLSGSTTDIRCAFLPFPPTFREVRGVRGMQSAGRRCPEEGGFEESSCVGGSGGDRRRLTEDDSIYCRAGHHGPRCALCDDDDDYFNQLQQRCESCPGVSQVAGIAVAICTAAVFVLILIRQALDGVPLQIPCTRSSCVSPSLSPSVFHAFPPLMRSW